MPAARDKYKNAGKRLFKLIYSGASWSDIASYLSKIGMPKNIIGNAENKFLEFSPRKTREMEVEQCQRYA